MQQCPYVALPLAVLRNTLFRPRGTLDDLKARLAGCSGFLLGPFLTESTSVAGAADSINSVLAGGIALLELV